MIMNWHQPEKVDFSIDPRLVELSQNKSSPDDLRYQGFKVAVHNDYMLNGENYTFWLMTKIIKRTIFAFKGEGKTDEEALNQIREQIINFKG